MFSIFMKKPGAQILPMTPQPNSSSVRALLIQSVVV